MISREATPHYDAFARNPAGEIRDIIYLKEHFEM